MVGRNRHVGVHQEHERQNYCIIIKHLIGRKYIENIQDNA
jgi:hypothetical protein